MTKDLIDSLAKYLIAGIVIIGCLVLIGTGRGDQVQPWTIIGLVIGWIIRDNAGSSATSNAVSLSGRSRPPRSAPARPSRRPPPPPLPPSSPTETSRNGTIVPRLSVAPPFGDI